MCHDFPVRTHGRTTQRPVLITNDKVWGVLSAELKLLCVLESTKGCQRWRECECNRVCQPLRHTHTHTRQTCSERNCIKDLPRNLPEL